MPISPAIILSISALAFTVFSFWWIQLRPGKLMVAKPRAWASVVLRAPNDVQRAISVPLVFFNRGALPIIVQNLRLEVPSLGATGSFAFNNTATQLIPNSQRAMATQFPVRGREAVSLICDFLRSPGELSLSAGQHTAELYAVLGDSVEWQRLLSFQLVVTEGAVEALHTGRWIALDNWAIHSEPAVCAT